MIRKKRILIVEDEKEVAEILAKGLQAEGYQTALAYNGMEGILKAAAFEPDLILLDLVMPEMGGIEFYQQICDSNMEPRYPILIVTAHANKKEVFKNFSIKGFITKPFARKDLINEIKLILAEKQQAENILSNQEKRIVVCDYNKEALANIEEIFKVQGYPITTLNTGTEAIENIVNNPPHLALINYQLPDISGDLVIFRIKNMTRSRGVQCVLYADRNAGISNIVLNKIANKSGIALLQTYSDPKELIDAVEKVFTGDTFVQST